MSHTATNCTSLCSRKQPRSYVPRLPMPIPPTTIRSLGATAPSRPNAELGMIVGAIAAAPAESAVCKNRRLLNCPAFFAMTVLLTEGIQADQVVDPCCHGPITFRPIANSILAWPSRHHQSARRHTGPLRRTFHDLREALGAVIRASSVSRSAVTRHLYERRRLLSRMEYQIKS